jgi:VWFA-related protein
LPIALVVAVQTSSTAGPAMAKVQKIGAMFEPLVAGDRGVLALLTYSNKITLRQEFTSDGKLFSAKMRYLEPDGGASKLNDAVVEAVKLLEDRKKYRRVLVVIGESKDRGSSATLEQVVTKAQAANVTIYPVNYSPFATAFTSKGDERFESGRRVYDVGSGPNLLAVFSEIGRLSEKNSSEALSKYTGGERLSFAKLSGLEKVISKVGDDLHTQYLLSFSPPENSGPVYHEITLKVKASGAVVRARPGYWAE